MMMQLSSRSKPQIEPGQLALTCLAHLSDVAMFAVDRNLRIVAADGGALRAAGWTPAAIVGRTLEDVLPLEAYTRLVGFYRSALGGRHRTFTYESLDGRRAYEVETFPEGELAIAIVRG
jgi:PAS domain S-box-containing protein